MRRRPGPTRRCLPTAAGALLPRTATARDTPAALVIGVLTTQLGPFQDGGLFGDGRSIAAFF
jgi:hypothetical protein